jgi:hypothetical protein
LNEGLGAIIRGVFLEIFLFGPELLDSVLDELDVEDIVANERSPELDGLGQSVDGVDDGLWVQRG